MEQVGEGVEDKSTVGGLKGASIKALLSALDGAIGPAAQQQAIGRGEVALMELRRLPHEERVSEARCMASSEMSTPRIARGRWQPC